MAATPPRSTEEIPQSAKNAVFIFLGALAVIVFFAIFQNLLPSYEDPAKAVKDAMTWLVAPDSPSRPTSWLRQASYADGD